jgi:hypothetical protein
MPRQTAQEPNGARCLFAYCAGIEGSQTTRVTSIDTKSKTAVWVYKFKKAGFDSRQIWLQKAPIGMGRRRHAVCFEGLTR